MHAIFESKEIHREALAALLLFQQAARDERLTVDRVESFIRYFKRARTEPSLRFRQYESADRRSSYPKATAYSKIQIIHRLGDSQRRRR